MRRLAIAITAGALGLGCGDGAREPPPPAPGAGSGAPAVAVDDAATRAVDAAAVAPPPAGPLHFVHRGLAGNATLDFPATGRLVTFRDPDTGADAFELALWQGGGPPCTDAGKPPIGSWGIVVAGAVGAGGVAPGRLDADFVEACNRTDEAWPACTKVRGSMANGDARGLDVASVGEGVLTGQLDFASDYIVVRGPFTALVCD